MTLADRTITVLRDLHDELAAVTFALTDTQLTAASGGAPAWTVAQVLSHLGSGAEISSASYAAAVTGGTPPDGDFNRAVWDRWDAKSPRAQADGFVEYNARLIETLEALTAGERASLPVKLGFRPAPFGVIEVTGLRLNEVAQHTWDIQVGFDPDAGLSEVAADVLLEQLSGPIGFFLGFIGKPAALSTPAVVDLAGRGLTVAATVSLAPAVDNPTAVFAGRRPRSGSSAGGSRPSTPAPPCTSTATSVSRTSGRSSPASERLRPADAARLGTSRRAGLPARPGPGLAAHLTGR